MMLVALGMTGWVLSSLGELHDRLAMLSPRLATVVVYGILGALLIILGFGAMFLWTALRGGRRVSRRPVAPSDPVEAAGQSISAAEQQIALVTSEVARRALSRELDAVAADLADHRFTVVVFGTVSAGKTSIINALLGRRAAPTDPITGTTKEGEEHAYSIGGFEAGQLRLVDTPGLSEIGQSGAMREEQARRLATDADLLVFVVDQDLRDIEFKPLNMLARIGKRSILVFNKSDTRTAGEVQAVIARLRDRVKGLIDADSIVVCAADPTPVLVKEDSATRTEVSPPDVVELADRVARVLRAEGRTLLAENVLLRAKRVSDKARDVIHADRVDKARTVVSRFTWTTAGVMFVNPVPGLGALAAAAINYQMVCEVARVFGVPINADVAKRMARELAQVLVKMGVVALSTEILGKALKASIVGYIAGGAIEAVAGAYLTQLAGAAFIDYFAHDQDWGEGGMQGAVERKFQLQRKQDFVVEFVKEAARRVLGSDGDGSQGSPRNQGKTKN